MGIKIIPYRTRLDRRWNRIYEFNFKPTNPKDGLHITEIKIDEINEILVDTDCTCKDTMINKNPLCKHKKEAIRILKENGIVFKEN